MTAINVMDPHTVFYALLIPNPVLTPGGEITWSVKGIAETPLAVETFARANKFKRYRTAICVIVGGAEPNTVDLSNVNGNNPQ